MSFQAFGAIITAFFPYRPCRNYKSREFSLARAPIQAMFVVGSLEIGQLAAMPTGTIFALFALLQPAAVFAAAVVTTSPDSSTDSHLARFARVALEQTTRLVPESAVQAQGTDFTSSPFDLVVRGRSETTAAPSLLASDHLIGAALREPSSPDAQSTGVPAGSPLFIAMTNAWRPPEHAALQGDGTGWLDQGQGSGARDPAEAVPLPSALALVSAGLALALAGRRRLGFNA